MISRARYFGLLLFLACGLVSTPAVTAPETPRDPYQYFFDATLGDFREELATARSQNKKGILMFFEHHECPFCHYMKNNVLNQPGVQAYFKKHFMNYAVDVSGDVEVTSFDGRAMPQKDFALREYRVRATPVFLFFDLKGETMVKFIGKTSGVDEFMLLGRYVVEEHYKKTSFTRFKIDQAGKQSTK